MKHLTTLLIAAFLFVACGPQKGKLRIRGKFDNLPQADLLIYSPDGGLSSIDTLHIMKGKFDYTTPLDKDVHTFVVVYPNFSTLSFMAHEGTEVRINGDALSLLEVKVEGADSVLPQVKHEGRNPVKIGKKLPKSKIIKQKPGTYLLIAFAAEWKHGSASGMNYYIRQALREKKDSLHAFTYMLDLESKVINKENEEDKRKLTEEEKQDTARWHTYCDYSGWSGPLLSKLGIRNIPYMILLDPSGKVVAMGNDYNKNIKPEIEKIGEKEGEG